MTARGSVAAKWLFATLGAASQVVRGKEFVRETVIENFPRRSFVTDPVYASHLFISRQL
jgi:hypothetical protein